MVAERLQPFLTWSLINCVSVCREKLNILMETFYNEVEKLRDNAIKVTSESLTSRDLINLV